MIIEKGTIFRKQNIVFKETQKLDTRMNNHPLLIPVEIDFFDDNIYFFTISSGLQYYTQDKDRYYMLKKQKGTGIYKTCLVDLKHVYKCPRTTPFPDGYLSPGLVDDIVKKFRQYPKINIDDDCQGLLDIIS